MSADDRADKGTRGAHTPPAPEGEPAGSVHFAPRSTGEAEQLDFLGGDSGNAKQEITPTGAGRPPGARNKVKLGIREYLLAKGYSHPGVYLAELYSHDTIALAKALGCKRIEVLAEQRKAATDLMGYFESKKPVALDLPESGGRPVIIIGGSTADAAEDDGKMGLDDPIEEIEEIQQVSDGEAVRPEDEGSHDDS